MIGAAHYEEHKRTGKRDCEKCLWGGAIPGPQHHRDKGGDGAYRGGHETPLASPVHLLAIDDVEQQRWGQRHALGSSCQRSGHERVPLVYHRLHGPRPLQQGVLACKRKRLVASLPVTSCGVSGSGALFLGQ